MILEELFLENYKIFAKKEFNFKKGLNLIIGGNSTGKTTILESILFAFTGEIFNNPINYYQQLSTVSLTFNLNNIINKIRLILKRKNEKFEKLFYLNDKKLENLKNFRSNFLSPFLLNAIDISTISQDSQNKKNFIDRFLKITDYEYNTLYHNHRKILKQKSNLLKNFQNKFDGEFFNSLNLKIAEYSSVISLKRLILLRSIKNNLEEFVARTWKEIKGLRIAYKLGSNEKIENIENFVNNFSSEKDLKNYIRNSYQKSLDLAKTHELEKQKIIVSSNRDNFEFLFLIEGRYYPISSILSQSQINIFVLILFLNFVKKVRIQFGYYPILLLDEPFVFLDDINTQKILKILSNYPQTIVTSNREISVLANKIYL